MAWQGTPSAGTLAIGGGNTPSIRHTFFFCPHRHPLKERHRTQRGQGRGKTGYPLICTPLGATLAK